MTDAVDFDEYDSEYFENLIGKISEHPDWKYREDNTSVREVAERASGFESEAEFYLDHEPTDGHLRLRVPHLTEPLEAVQGNFVQQLRQSEESGEGLFDEELSAAYASIVEEHGSEYVESGVNLSRPADFHVPFDYSETELNDSLDSLTRIAEEIDELNENVAETIESRI